MRPTGARAVATMALIVLATACDGLMSGSHVCVLGPCTTTGSREFLLTFVTGFPPERVTGSVGTLAPGDTVRLSVVRVRSYELPCSPRDTVRDSVRWAVSDSSVATITATAGGQGLLRARAAGAFHLVMMVGGSMPITAGMPPQYVAICPQGGLVADFRVAP